MEAGVMRSLPDRFQCPRREDVTMEAMGRPHARLVSTGNIRVKLILLTKVIVPIYLFPVIFVQDLGLGGLIPRTDGYLASSQPALTQNALSTHALGYDPRLLMVA